MASTHERNGKWKSTLIGCLLLAGSGFLLYSELIPWPAMAGAWVIGLYLCLPWKMRKFWELTVWVFEKAIKAWRSKSGGV